MSAVGHQAIRSISARPVLSTDELQWDVHLTFMASELVAVLNTAANVARREGLVNTADRLERDAQVLERLSEDDRTMVTIGI